ncbi:hypothetical protein ACVW00_001096 [Marmoricola sp. URHA0025 HA25]
MVEPVETSGQRWARTTSSPTQRQFIPMKERVVDRKFDPLVWLGNRIGIRNKDNDGREEL